MEEIILHAMARDPEERYPSAAAMKADADAPGQVELAGRAGRLQAPKPWKNRWRGVRTAIIAVVVPIALFFLFLFLLNRRGHWCGAHDSMSNFLQRSRTAMKAFAQAWRGQTPTASWARRAPSSSAEAGAGAAAAEGIRSPIPAAPPPIRAPGWPSSRSRSRRTCRCPPTRSTRFVRRRRVCPPKRCFPTTAAASGSFAGCARAAVSRGASTEMQASGLLSVLFPELGPIAHAARAIGVLERLPYQATVAGERFGGLLSEIAAPETLVLALLFHDAEPALDRVALPRETRQAIAFLIRHAAEMSRVAFRRDAEDPDVVRAFAALFSTEEHLKMLTLITLANLGASSPETLTPWKEELLWRLYVDTYNEITMAYGDQVIDDNETALAAVRGSLPADISEAELARFLAGLPRRYLTLFEPATIYEHVRLWRDIKDDDVHFFLKQRDDVWELTVVTLDKPFLFSNICGVLAYFGMNILRGYALTSLSGSCSTCSSSTTRRGSSAGRTRRRSFRRGCRTSWPGAWISRSGCPGRRPPARGPARRRSSTSTTSIRGSTPFSSWSPTMRRGCCIASAG